MSNLSLFLKGNKKQKEVVVYAPTKTLTDEEGNPLEFKWKAISVKQDEALRDSCTKEVQVTGKTNLFRPQFNTNKYLAKMIAACCVEPDLYNAELQNSYGVMTPEDLIREMVDNPGEYQDLTTFVQDLNGFNTSKSEKVEQAKN